MNPTGSSGTAADLDGSVESVALWESKQQGTAALQTLVGGAITT